MENLQKKERERHQMLVKVARMYYEHDLSQQDIADRFSISRPYVSKLLQQAKENGIVNIEIIDTTAQETLEERKIREYFGLKKVIIAPQYKPRSALTCVADAAALYIEDVLKDGDIIGYSWGETVFECAKSLSLSRNFKDIVTVQLCGGVSNVRRNVYVSELSRVFSDRIGSTGYILPFPAIVDSVEMKEMINEEHIMQEALHYAGNASISIVTVGKFGNNCALARAGYLSTDDIKKLKQRGAVGDICTHVINENGEICDEEMEKRTVAIPLETIKKIETRIGVAIGEEKVKSSLAALKGGFINVFITDELMIEHMGEIHPEIFE